MSRASGKRAADSANVKGSSRSGYRSVEVIEVTLEHSRWRHFGWALFCLVAGGALIIKLGTVGKGIGVVFLVIAARNAFLFARTLLSAAGTIRVNADGVALPRGLCRGPTRTFAPGDVRHAFLLRRAVPWTRTGPLLVIEVGERAFVYPRDWFTSETDQRRIARAIVKHKEPRPDKPA